MAMLNADMMRFRRGDAVAIGAVLLAAIVIILFFLLRADGQQRRTAQIYHDDALICEMPLDQDDQYVIEGEYRNVITVKGGRAAITESDCPGGDCMHSGWQSASGRSIVCLPNRTEVRIVGAPAAFGEGHPDAIVG